MWAMPCLKYPEKAANDFSVSNNRWNKHGNLDMKSIIGELKSNHKTGVLDELAGTLSGVSNVPQEVLVDGLTRREIVGSTGVGHGLALPNCRLFQVDACYLVFAHSAAGVDWDSFDGEPVHLFFAFCSPARDRKQHIRFLARLSRPLKNGILRNRLEAACERQEMAAILAEAGLFNIASAWPRRKENDVDTEHRSGES